MILPASMESEADRAGPSALLDRIRYRIIVALATLFVVTMLVAGPLSGDAGLGTLLGGSTAVVVLRLGIVAVVLPLVMLAFARRILEPAEDLARTNGRLQAMYDAARVDALIDPLSGLGNHRAFQEEFGRQIEDARRRETSLALVLIDLDNLKLVNDKAGHATGDLLLEATGRLLASATRSADRAFRVGGDEFALLLPGTDAQMALVIARRLLVQALEPGSGPQRRPISFSAGVSAYPELGTEAGRLYRQADAALYACKRHGRTGVECFDPARHGASGDERTTPELAAAVARVAATRALRPVYQPIFSLATGEPIAFEGLARPSEDAGFRNAEALFVAAEAAGRTIELDIACLEAIVGNVVLAPGQYLSVNLSPRTVESDEFSAGDLVARFERAGLRPDQIVLELTEREVVEDVERLRRRLDACRNLGMRVAVDDVGAGNAGLQLLSQVRFDIVKIDLSLVQRGVLRESALGVLRAIGELARRWDASIVAEGVETPEQLETVQELGFGAAQGFLLGRPDDVAVAERIDLAAFAVRRAWVGLVEPEPPVDRLGFARP